MIMRGEHNHADKNINKSGMKCEIERKEAMELSLRR